MRHLPTTLPGGRSSLISYCSVRFNVALTTDANSSSSSSSGRCAKSGGHSDVILFLRHHLCNFLLMSHLSADNNNRSDSLSTFFSTPYYAPNSGKKFHVSHYPHIIHIDFIYYLRQVGSLFIGVNLFIYLLAGLRKLQFRLLFNRAIFPETTRNLCRVSLRSSESNEENLRKTC